MKQIDPKVQQILKDEKQNAELLFNPDPTHQTRSFTVHRNINVNLDEDNIPDARITFTENVGNQKPDPNDRLGFNHGRIDVTDLRDLTMGEITVLMSFLIRSLLPEGVEKHIGEQWEDFKINFPDRYAPDKLKTCWKNAVNKEVEKQNVENRKGRPRVGP